MHLYRDMRASTQFSQSEQQILGDIVGGRLGQVGHSRKGSGRSGLGLGCRWACSCCSRCCLCLSRHRCCLHSDARLNRLKPLSPLTADYYACCFSQAAARTAICMRNAAGWMPDALLENGGPGCSRGDIVLHKLAKEAWPGSGPRLISGRLAGSLLLLLVCSSARVPAQMPFGC